MSCGNDTQSKQIDAESAVQESATQIAEIRLKSVILGAQLSADGSLLAIQTPKSIDLFSLKMSERLTLKKIKSISVRLLAKEEERTISHMSITPNGETLICVIGAMGQKDGVAIAFDIEKMTVLGGFNIEACRSLKLTADGSKAFLLDTSGRLHIWDLLHFKVLL